MTSQEIEVVEVSKDRKQVTIRAMNVYFVFRLDAKKRLRIALKTKRDAHYGRGELSVPTRMYREACRRAGAILRESCT